MLFSIVREPMAASEIARKLGVDRQLVHYHLKSLTNDGLAIRIRTGKAVKYLARIERLIEYSFLSAPDLSKREELMKKILDVFNTTQLSHHNDMNFIEMNANVVIRNIVVNALFHAFRLLDPFYSYHSSVFLRELGNRLAKFVLTHTKHKTNERCVSALAIFKEIFDADISLTRIKHNYLLRVNRFMGFTDFDVRVDDVLLAFIESLFSNLLNRKVVVKKYPDHSLRRHYTYLIKNI